MGKIEIYDTKKYLSFGLLIENLENEIFEITILAHHAIEEYNENQRINGGDIVEYIHVAKI